MQGDVSARVDALLSRATKSDADDLNYERSGGQFNKLRRKLTHFEIVKNESNGKYLVKDKSGRTVGSGYSSPEEAKRHWEAEDMRKSGLL